MTFSIARAGQGSSGPADYLIAATALASREPTKDNLELCGGGVQSTPHGDVRTRERHDGGDGERHQIDREIETRADRF